MTVIPEPPETEVVTAARVACDGGVGALGHPRVWLTLGEDGAVECPYCDKRFITPARAAAEAAGK